MNVGWLRPPFQNQAFAPAASRSFASGSFPEYTPLIVLPATNVHLQGQRQRQSAGLHTCCLRESAGAHFTSAQMQP